MPLVKYRIYELSARAVISYGRQQDGAYTFHLSAAETEKCKSLSAPHEQDDNALFYQSCACCTAMPSPEHPAAAGDGPLRHHFLYGLLRHIRPERCQKEIPDPAGKSEALFRPEGVSLDFGSGPHRYLAFERSGSMSRQARLSSSERIFMMRCAAAS